jgi:cell division protein FtsQ
VREVTVRRRFPDVAEVTFEAHRAAARWGDAQLVSDRGEVFTAPGGDNLPRLRGPDASAAPMVRELPEIVSRLAPLAIAVAEVRLSARGAWEVVLATGLTLELGRGEIGPRMQRFVEAWPRAGEAAAAARYADLRYANGFALRRAADINPTPARAAARKK